MDGVTFVDPTDQRPRVIGLDLSLTATGVASNHGWVALAGRPRITTVPLPGRLAAVDELVQEICDLAGAPDLVVIEGVNFAGPRLKGVLERDALWWLVVRRMSRRAPVAIVPPTARAKYATGKGNAGKTEVVDAVARRYPQFNTRGDDNLCDAVVLAAMGSHVSGWPLAEVPKTHSDALDKVLWPELPELAEPVGAVSD